MENCLVTILACLIFFAGMVLLAPIFTQPPPPLKDKVSSIRTLARDLSDVEFLGKLVLCWTMVRIMLIPSLMSAIVSAAFLLSMASIAAICAPDSTPEIIKYFFDKAFELLENIANSVFSREVPSGENGAT